jgi:sulfur-oxidizing protein SoxX
MPDGRDERAIRGMRDGRDRRRAPFAARSAIDSSARSSAFWLSILCSILACPVQVNAQRIDGDAMPEPLTTLPGDPVRGRQIVADRRSGLCLLCHPAPIPEERFQGDLAPDLAGVGSRLTEGQLRLRIVDSRRVLPESIMPAFHRTNGLRRVAREREGQPVLDPQQVEDVVAWLRTLK